METPPKNMMCGTDGPYLLPSTALISAAPPKLVSRIRLEEGGSDPLHGAVFKAAQEIGYSITVHESCVVYGYKGTIDYVKVPIGFPLWFQWEQLPHSSTYRVVDGARGKMWLFRYRTFKSKPLSGHLLKAREPWFYEEPSDAYRKVTAGPPPTPVVATTEQATTLQPAACPSSLLKELMTTGNDVPVGAEETVPATAAAPESEPVPIWFRNEDGDYFPGDALQPIHVPEGYPGWQAWAQIPHTRTLRAIDLDTQTLCLFRDGLFKKRPLTYELLVADDPWFHHTKGASAASSAGPIVTTTGAC